ncbi:MAG: hypothetical protein H0T66_12460 [Geodermatophilaceae bacterium]|nr:hypothetical protein [Geodermatophilaceae bacterium]
MKRALLVTLSAVPAVAVAPSFTAQGTACTPPRTCRRQPGLPRPDRPDGHGHGQPAQWSRNGAELTIVPAAGLPSASAFTTAVRYDGVPDRVEGAGFIHTDDGAVIIGEPHVVATCSRSTTIPATRRPTSSGSPSRPGWRS